MGLIDDALRQVGGVADMALTRALERQPRLLATERPRYVLGLDLGQTHDYSALTLDEVRNGGQPDSRHGVIHLQRWPLRTPYPQIVTDVAKMVQRAPITPEDSLVIDQTGVGRPVVDMFRDEHMLINLIAVTITGGIQVTHDGDEWRVPKRDLVSIMQVLIQSGRMQVSRKLPEAATLMRELGTFQMKITLAANEQYGAWREGTNDDTVLATALAAWWAEHGGNVGVWIA